MARRYGLEGGLAGRDAAGGEGHSRGTPAYLVNLAPQVSPAAGPGITGFLSRPAAAKSHHWQENLDETIIIEIEVKAPEADVPLAGFVDFPRSGKTIVEISNIKLTNKINRLFY
jgi:hypothetical protein